VGLARTKHRQELVAGFAQLAHRIDLVDEHLALDEAGDGRGSSRFSLYWKHQKDFFGLVPTGREGTSIETAIFTIAGTRSPASTSRTTRWTWCCTCGTAIGRTAQHPTQGLADQRRRSSA
jgi:hypothetical protein